MPVYKRTPTQLQRCFLWIIFLETKEVETGKKMKTSIL